MALIDNFTLRQIAHRRAADHVASLATARTTLVTFPDDPVEWEPMLRRNVYQADYTVWVETGRIEVAVDDHGRIYRFIDHARSAHAREHQEVVQLPVVDLIEIARTSGLVSPYARSVAVWQDAVPHRLAIEQFVPDLPNRVSFEIDPVARVIIRLDVTERVVP